jgi:hypothetical protein
MSTPNQPGLPCHRVDAHDAHDHYGFAPSMGERAAHCPGVTEAASPRELQDERAAHEATAQALTAARPTTEAS